MPYHCSTVSMPCWWNQVRRLGGNASAASNARLRFEMSSESSCAFSTMMRRNDGVPAYASGASVRINSICCSVWPMPAGITAQPSLRAAPSIIHAPGVM